MRRLPPLLACLAAGWPALPPPANAQASPLQASPLQALPLQSLPPGFVRLADVAPGIVEDIRYAGADNFTLRPVPGYGAAQCWLRKEAAEALARVARKAQADGLRLVVHDCYRPLRATAAFVEWAKAPDDPASKARFYPDVEKRELFARGYIARRSAHSFGSTVDAVLAKADGGALDYGAAFDLFSPRSAVGAPGLAPAAAHARADLAARMKAEGFVGYKREYWHFTLGWTAGAASYDVEIR